MFSIQLLAYITANPALKRDAAKARRPLAPRYASIELGLFSRAFGKGNMTDRYRVGFVEGSCEAQRGRSLRVWW